MPAGFEHVHLTLLEGSMEETDLKVIWLNMSQATFDKFVKENIGYKETAAESGNVPPACFDTGDGSPWCVYCNFKAWC